MTSKTRMKMKTNLLFLLPFVILVACTQNAPEDKVVDQQSESKVSIIYKGESPYLDWYLSGKESFASCILKMFPEDTIGKQYDRVLRAEDNTITLKNDARLKIHDDYTLENDGQLTELQLTRSCCILRDGQNAPRKMKSVLPDTITYYSNSYTYTIQSATPINIIRPAIDNCNPIPLCYYDNFIVEWNSDTQNQNGVVVVAEWNGATISQSPQNISIASVDIVDDTGIAALDTAIFRNMPDEALVNLWLIRGNLITIDGGEVTLEKVLESYPEDIEKLLMYNPEFFLQLQPFMFGSGAIATFSFFLIRNL